jgi:uncharacterized phage protein gp47/JayE
MATSINDLTRPLTTEELKSAIYEYIAATGTKTTNWKPGAVVRTIVAVLAFVLAAFSVLTSLLAKSGFLELSSGAWLTLVARYVYGVERDTGSFATGFVTLDNAGGGVYSGDPDDLLFTNPTTGKSYRNAAAYSIGSGETGVVVAIRAVELGSASTSGTEEITQLETPLVGVTCTNAAAVVGTDPETDESLRARCVEQTGAASPNGPRDAYAFFAKSARRADGTSVGVTRVNPVPDGLGGIDVYVATASGTVTGTSGDPSTDLGAVAKAIHENAEPLAITPEVQSATPLSIAVTYELWVRSTTGLTSAQVEDLVEAALIAFMAAAPIGGWVISPATGKIYVSAIRAAIASALPDGSLVRIDVTLPAADVDVETNEAPALGTVTVTSVHFVTGGS